MNAEVVAKLLVAHQNHGKPFRITVNGVSMNPVLQPNDTITLCRQEQYEIGDILVYNYKDEGILAHRLLKKKKDRYICKGDNAFRTEEIGMDDIIGKVVNKVVGDDEKEIYHSRIYTRLICLASMAVNKKFIKAGSVAKTKSSFTYRLYKMIYLRSGFEK